MSSSLDIAAGQIVSVKVLSNVDDAVQCFIEPMTIEDWEILEAHANWLEGGGLLQQVCIIYPEQILTLTLGVSDFARVRVLECTFSQKNDHCNNLWADVDKSNPSKNVRLSAVSCLRLVADTNVIVSPKKREVTKASTCYPRLRLIPCQQDYCNTQNWNALKMLTPLSHNVISVLPFSVVVHPNVASKIIGNLRHSEQHFICIVRANFKDKSNKNRRSGHEVENPFAVVFLSTSIAIPVDCAGKQSSIH